MQHFCRIDLSRYCAYHISSISQNSFAQPLLLHLESIRGWQIDKNLHRLIVSAEPNIPRILGTMARCTTVVRQPYSRTQSN